MRGQDSPPFDDKPHRRRLKRIEGQNHARFLTFSCFQRRQFLSVDRTRRWMIEAIELARSKHAFDLWAYVIMPEHMHLLLWPRRGADGQETRVGPILGTMKQSISKRAIAWVKANAPSYLPKMRDTAPNGRVVLRFWQRGAGHDRNLWSAKHVWEKINYIHANPVERGLCRLPTDWIWSSAIEFEKRGAGLIRIDRDSIPWNRP